MAGRKQLHQFKSAKEYHADWREEHRDHLNEQARLNYRKNKVARRASSNASAKRIYDAMTPEQKHEYALRQKANRLRRKYSLTSEQWQDLFKTQGCRCAVCNTDDPGKVGWATDHCHATGRVRGILCHDCNKALGFAKDNPETLRSMIAYLTGAK